MVRPRYRRRESRVCLTQVDEEREAEIRRIDELEAEISEKRHARREAVAWLASDLMYELVRDRMSLEQWTKRLHPDEMVNVVDAVKLLIDRGDVVVDRQGGSAQYSKAMSLAPTQARTPTTS